MTRMTGWEAVVAALRAESVPRVYGLPGDPRHLYEALYEAPEIQAVLVRHEASGAFMAMAEARVAEGVPAGGRDRLHAALAGDGSLGDDHDREAAPALVAAAQARADLLYVERALRDEDRVGASSQSCVRRDPARMAAHHLDDHHSIVRLRCRMQPVDRVGDDLHGRLEAKRDIGPSEVVVDRLRHADDRNPLTLQAQGHAERVLAADWDQRVDGVLVEDAADLAGAVASVGEGVRA